MRQGEAERIEHLLAESWGEEWHQLWRISPRLAWAVADDFHAAGISAEKYKRNIFAGNLLAYAKCLIVPKRADA